MQGITRGPGAITVRLARVAAAGCGRISGTHLSDHVLTGGARGDCGRTDVLKHETPRPGAEPG